MMRTSSIGTTSPASVEDRRGPFGWVAGDGGLGQYREVRDWATTGSVRYVLAVPSSQPLERVHGMDGQAEVKRGDDLLTRAHRRERRSRGPGAKRYYDWALFTGPGTVAGKGHIREPTEDHKPYASTDIPQIRRGVTTAPPRGKGLCEGCLVL